MNIVTRVYLRQAVAQRDSGAMRAAVGQSKVERRIELRQRLRMVRSLERQVAVLRVALADMLEDAEDTALTSYWPHGDHPPGKPRLCKILADEMLWGDDVERADLRRIKRARRALGLEPWWNLP